MFAQNEFSGMTRNEILQATGLTSAGGTTQKLRELENCDFIREYTSYGERKERLYQLINGVNLTSYDVDFVNIHEHLG